MATQNVKFHSTTAEKYSGIENPDAGSLYFLSDNGEIRKGDKHITGTRVFLAEDESLSGCSSVDSLEITLDGKPLAESGETVKRGDMLRVMHYITTKVVVVTDEEGNPVLQEDGKTQVTKTVLDKDGPVEYSAYIYSGNGGDYDTSKWQACDGNVDASKVILTQNITMAGNYSSIGNFSKTNAAGKNSTFMQGGVGTAGASVFELIKQMLSKTNEPTWKRNPPIAKIEVKNPAGEYEVGKEVSATFTATL